MPNHYKNNKFLEFGLKMPTCQPWF